MGRKPLGVKSMTIRLPAGIGAKIDAAAGGANMRAAFIRSAVTAALAARSKPKKKSVAKPGKAKRPTKARRVVVPKPKAKAKVKRTTRAKKK